MTDAAVLATDDAWEEWGDSTTKEKIDNRAYYIANKWNNSIGANNDKYWITVYSEYNITPYLFSPSDTREARDQSRRDIENQGGFNDHDAVVVIDSRTFSDRFHGFAWIETAGSNYGCGYVNGDGGKRITAHELCHTYGGEHGDSEDDDSTFESTEFHRSIMGNYGTWDCNNNKSYTSAGHWFAECTEYHVKNYMDDNGLTR